MERIGIIGAGNMGWAIIKGLIEYSGVQPEFLSVYDIAKEKIDAIKSQYDVTISTDNKDILSRSKIIILCIKPQDVDNVLKDIRGLVKKDMLIISILAGISIRKIEDAFALDVPVIRAMPNTPALVGEGMTAICGGRHIKDGHIESALNIFNSVGKTVVVKEEYLDIVTGLSGSGPAYVFVIAEALADGGVKLGLPRDVADTLAAQTLLGSAKLLIETSEHPGVLKDKVTSPGGTTAAGLFVLEQGGVRASIISAVEAATNRARKLGG